MQSTQAMRCCGVRMSFATIDSHPASSAMFVTLHGRPCCDRAFLAFLDHLTEARNVLDETFYRLYDIGAVVLPKRYRRAQESRLRGSAACAVVSTSPLVHAVARRYRVRAFYRRPDAISWLDSTRRGPPREAVK